MGREKVICCWEVDGVLVDPGPQSCEETLLEAIGHEKPRALLLTHIHFDHAGAAGALVRRWPDLPVYVHERGAPHLVDPAKLVKSAARLYGGEEGLRRLGCDATTTDFFDEHVTADAVHEAIAAVDLAGGLVRQDPRLAADVIWGARALVELEGRFARRLLDAWGQGRSSLLERLVNA